LQEHLLEGSVKKKICARMAQLDPAELSRKGWEDSARRWKTWKSARSQGP